MASTNGDPSLIRSATWGIPGRLYFITMDDGPMDHLRQIEAAAAAGIRWIQLRMKNAGTEAFLETARAAMEICKKYGSRLFVNDRVEVARLLKTHGVHLGQQDMPVGEARRQLGEDCMIGGTANTIADIREHVRQGADYIGLGPYRHTRTKKNLSPVLGLEGYRHILKQLRSEGIGIPVVAIGGIMKEDLAGLLDAGVYGIAFSGLLVHAADGPSTVRMLEAEMGG